MRKQNHVNDHWNEIGTVMGIVILSREFGLPSTNVGEMSTVEFSTAVIYFARSEEFNDDRMQKISV